MGLLYGRAGRLTALFRRFSAWAVMGNFGNRTSKEKLNFYKATREVAKNKYWHQFIRRVRGTKEQHLQRVEDWERVYHKDPPKGKRRWFLPETTIAVDNLKKHIARGCYDFGWATLVRISLQFCLQFFVARLRPSSAVLLLLIDGGVRGCESLTLAS